MSCKNNITENYTLAFSIKVTTSIPTNPNYSQFQERRSGKMRRPLVRHLSEGGGGEGGRRQSIRPDEDLLGGGLPCRDYRRHQSSCDLLKVPALNPRGRLSPEPRITVTGIFNNR